MLESTEAILSFIAKYGLPLVALVLVMRWLVPKLDQAWEVFLERAQGTKDVHHDDDKIRGVLNIDMEMNELLLEALHQCGADYCTVWQLHNGGMSVGGLFFLRISATHQQVKRGNVGWAHYYQGIPTSLFIAQKSMSALISQNETSFVDRDAPDGAETLVGIMLAHGLDLMVLSPIRDSDARLTGLFGLSYRKPNKLLREDLLPEYASRACVLLELQARLLKGGSHG